MTRDRVPKARERDLAHGADDTRFGAAVLKCEGFTPNCSQIGRCERDGQCFASPGHLVAARMIERLLPPGGRQGTHFAYIRRVAEMLRAGEISI